MRAFYEKFNSGSPLTDEELEDGIEFFTELEKSLSSLGPVFKLPANEVRRILYCLESFKTARIGN
jgi:hypothetical protein